MSSATAEWPEAEQRIADVARTRRGRHRDKVLASYRRTRALELRAQGLGYAEIAHEVGYANKGTAHKVITQALEAREVRDVENLRALEVARLDALQVALWPKAVRGDVAAVDGVRKIILARMRLFGLVDVRRGKDQRQDWPCCQGPDTLVVRVDDCRHDGCAIHGRFGQGT